MMRLALVRELVMDAHLDLTPTQKLMLMALAIYCHDDGSNIRPSLALLAVNASVSTSQARRILKELEDMGYLKTVGRANGGRPGDTKLRKLNLDAIRRDGKLWWTRDAKRPNRDHVEIDPFGDIMDAVICDPHRPH